MDIKNLILKGSFATAIAVLGACSDDGDSATAPEADSSSSVAMVTSVTSSGDSVQVPVSSAADPTSSATTAASSSSEVLVSSSSLSNTDEPQMACSEIMYADTSSLEWVEVYIAGGMDMDNMVNFNLHLSGDVDYPFPAEPLTKGEYVVVTNDTALFASRYPNFAGRVFGPFSGKLTNEGGVVNVKVTGEGDVTCAFSNEPPWPSLADGNGHSLVYTGGIASQSVSWCASALAGGNPGVGGDACIDVTNSVRINEVKPSVNEAGTYEASWMELYNSGSTDVDVSGWTVYVKERKDSIKIVSGVVPAGGYLVLDGATGFSEELVVSAYGGEIYLYGLVEGQESSIWIPAGTSVSGTVDVADGSIAQGALATATPGAANSALKLGSVYISEIHYHPDESGSLPFEFLELANSSDAAITLYNSALGKGWKVEGINLEFTATASIPAHGKMLLIPATLEDVSITGWGADLVRSSYGIADDVQIITYTGKLSNRGETIAVKEPYATSDSKVYYTWDDATLYSDAWAGLTEADGYGYSLQRTDVTTMGYGPAVWTAAEPTPGK